MPRQLQPAPRASWLVLLDDDQLDNDQQAARNSILAADSQIVTVDQMARLV